MVYNRVDQDVHGQAPTAEGTHSRQADRHDLALLFIILACGAHADFNLPFHNEDTKRYRQLARAALASKSVFDTATLSAVQAIALMAQLDVLLGRDNALESSWRLMCLTLSLAMSVSPESWHAVSFRLTGSCTTYRSDFVSFHSMVDLDMHLSRLTQTVILLDGIWVPHWFTADVRRFGLFTLVRYGRFDFFTIPTS